VMTLARTPIARVASGMGFHVLIDEAGRVLTVGKNKKGQLGNGLKQDSMRRPYVVEVLARYYAIQVAAGECHSLVLTSGGDVFGSGSNEYGQLGFGPVPEVTRMTKIPLPGKCIGIAAGPLGSMFALNDGRVFSCGFNDVQQLGLGVDYQAQRSVLVPTCIPPQIVNGVHVDDVNVAESIKANDGPSITSPVDTAFALSRSIKGSPLGSQGTPTKTKTTLCQNCCTVM
jgi:alpha-tubulin suppressor-like RCC1 family protein